MNFTNDLPPLSSFLRKAKNPLIVILGPTGCGKTSLSISLAKKYNGEIINADSRQIYEGMNIGTAKISEKEMENVPHHLLSFVKPNEIFTAAEYKKKAVENINNILQRGKVPFLVGGTGLYINAICFNYDIPKVVPNYELREKLEKEAEENSWELGVKSKEKGANFLHQKLTQLDPETAQKIHPNQKRYVIRALEIVLSGTTKSKEAKKKKSLFDCFFIGINIPREALYERINQRVDTMIERGLIEEVKGLLSQGYDEKSHAMNGIGYKEILSYLRKELPLDAAKDLIKRNSRHYAKRQMTWFRKLEGVHWIQHSSLAISR